jgi:hypothetical protein
MISLITANNLSAKDIPIVNSLELEVDIDKTTILEFPFEITAIKKGRFIREIIQNESDKIDKTKEATPNLSLPQVSGKEILDTSKPKSVKLEKGKNNVLVTPYKTGNIELLIWGYSQYPIIVSVKAKNLKDSEQYYNFIDNKTSKSDVSVFENDVHDKVISKIIKNLYLKTTPSGYKLKPLNYTKNESGLSMNGVNSFIGLKYNGLEFLVTNTTDSFVKLSEEQFLGSGVYAVAIEQTNLNPNETTRLFLVTK